MSNRTRAPLWLIALAPAAAFGYWIVSTILRTPWGVMD
jgi:hypothetical protein